MTQAYDRFATRLLPCRQYIVRSQPIVLKPRHRNILKSDAAYRRAPRGWVSPFSSGGVIWGELKGAVPPPQKFFLAFHVKIMHFR